MEEHKERKLCHRELYGAATDSKTDPWIRDCQSFHTENRRVAHSGVSVMADVCILFTATFKLQKLSWELWRHIYIQLSKTQLQNKSWELCFIVLNHYCGKSQWFSAQNLNTDDYPVFHNKNNRTRGLYCDAIRRFVMYLSLNGQSFASRAVLL